MSHHPLTVANTIVVLEANEGRVLDALEVGMLTYEAHAWVLAYTGKPLCSEPVKAWRHGPAFDSIVEAYRSLRRQEPVTRLATTTDVAGKKACAVIPKSEASTREMIVAVLDAHRHMTGVQLCNGTHEDGGPWMQARRTAREDERPVIPQQWIIDWCRARLNRSEASQDFRNCA